MARAMKDSGIAWIGEIPEEWEVVQLKKYANFNNGKEVIREIEESEDAIPVYGSGGVFKYTDSCMYKGESVLFGRKGTLGKPLYINTGFWAVDTMYYLTYSKSVFPKYNYYQMVAFDWQPHITQTALPSIVASEIVSCKFAFPSINEQTHIANYLDDECARIDAVIEQTRASIEEYKKLKQAVITQAVTKGIRPNRPMKDSGVDWIGKVPCDWQVTKLKYFATIRSGITLGKIYPADTKLVEYPYLRVANVQGSYTDLSDVATIAVTEEEAEKYRLHDGELLMTEGGDRDKLGRGTVWHAEIDPCLHQNHVFALRTNENLLAEYVSYLSESLVGRDYFDVTANQSVHLASTNSTTILNFTIPYPKVDEQREIVQYLYRRILEISELISKKQSLLIEIESLKRALIYEYVTGKKEL